MGAVDAPGRGLPDARAGRPAPRPRVLRGARAGQRRDRPPGGDLDGVRPAAASPTRHPYRTRLFSTGTEVRIEFRYKHSRVKQNRKGGRALRVETVINKPSDLDLPARLHHLPALVDKARAVNQRLLMIERAGQSCAIGSALYDAHPPALPPREPQNRLPRSNTYVLTDEGIRVAVVYTKLHNRLLRPLLDADKPPAPIDVRNALKTLESAVNQYVDNARLAPAS